MKTSAFFFPFDLFGSGGTAAGAELLADGVKEMLADNRRERRKTRARAYQDQVHVREFTFEKLKDYQRWRPQARRHIRQALERGDFLLWASGNHLGVLPVYDELASQFPDTLVLQFDAHLDIYNLTDCTEELSHGNFLLHCTKPLPPLVNLGHRELLLPEDYIKKHYQQAWAATDMGTKLDAILTDLRKRSLAAKQIFIDLDCDVFDPAYFPALTHPQPFGLSPALVLQLIDAVWSEKVIGLALSEFAPARDRDDRSLATLLWLIEYILLRRYEDLT